MEKRLSHTGTGQDVIAGQVYLRYVRYICVYVLIGHRRDISPFLVCILSHIVGPVGLVGPEGLVGPWVW